MRIKEVLKENERVYFSILPDDKDRFLKQAKEEGFVWLNGNEINESDCCNGHMAVHKDMRIAIVPWFAWFHPDTASIPKIDYSSFLNGEYTESKDELIAYDLENS